MYNTFWGHCNYIVPPPAFDPTFFDHTYYFPALYRGRNTFFDDDVKCQAKKQAKQQKHDHKHENQILSSLPHSK